MARCGIEKSVDRRASQKAADRVSGRCGAGFELQSCRRSGTKQFDGEGAGGNLPAAGGAAQDAGDGIFRWVDPLRDCGDDGRSTRDCKDKNPQRAVLAEKGVPSMSEPRRFTSEDLALFAMQLLPPEEMAEVAAYVEQSEDARRELAEIQGDLAAFAHTVEMQSPSAQARERLMKQVRNEKKAVPITRPAEAEASTAASAGPE